MPEVYRKVFEGGGGERMVYEVNRTQVEPSEILSDHVYE